MATEESINNMSKVQKFVFVGIKNVYHTITHLTNNIYIFFFWHHILDVHNRQKRDKMCLLYLYWNRCVTCVVSITVIKRMHVNFASLKRIKCPRSALSAVLSNHDLNARLDTGLYEKLLPLFTCTFGPASHQNPFCLPNRLCIWLYSWIIPRYYLYIQHQLNETTVPPVVVLWLQRRDDYFLPDVDSALDLLIFFFFFLNKLDMKKY